MENARPTAKRFTDLIVWQKAHQFVLSIYQMTATFPKAEVYGLTSQFRRAAVSIPANIAEGFRKHSKAEKGRYLEISLSSLEECRYYLILAKDLGYSPADEYNRKLEEVSKILIAYAASVRRGGSTSPDS